MFSQKTNNARFGRAFLITVPLLLLNGGVLGLLTDQLVGTTKASGTMVKDETVVVTDAASFPAREEAPQEEIISDEKPVITVYTVRSGDTLSGIASQFNISTNTILWANDLNRSSKIKIGQKLTILPVTGVKYTVKKGDTISSIAKKFDGDIEEILSYNDLENAGKIVVGMELIIPNGEFAIAHQQVERPAEKKASVAVAPASAPTKNAVTTAEKTTVVETSSSIDVDDAVNNGAVPPVQVRNVSTVDYFSHPVPGSVLTQGRHGYNAVDFGAPTGTPILAAADGVVIVEKGAGKWYGGYGNYIVIEHDNGTQTLYSHNSKNLVNVGDMVKQGQTIALVGSTGRSTGPHLHFEVRGGTNPWVGVKKLTQF